MFHVDLRVKKMINEVRIKRLDLFKGVLRGLTDRCAFEPESLQFAAPICKGRRQA